MFPVLRGALEVLLRRQSIALAREKTKTSVIARKLKRSERATYQKAPALGVSLGRGRRERRSPRWVSL